MTSKPRLFLADDNQASFDFFSSTIESAGWAIAGYAKDFDSFVNRAIHSDADVMIISSGFLAVMNESERRALKVSLPGRLILAITDSDDFVELKAAVRAGARDCLCYGDSKEKIIGLIYEYFSEAAAVRDIITNRQVFSSEEPVLQKPEGKVFAFCGADGGTGKSFLALQAAGMAALHAGAKTCLVDFDLSCGALSGQIAAGAPGERSLADLEGVIDEIRADHIENLLRDHKGGFSVICGPAPEIIESEEFYKAIVDSLRQMFDVVIIDFPPNPGPLFPAAVLDTAFIVMSPDAASARSAARMASIICAANENVDVTGIINRSDRSGAINLEEIKRLSGLGIAALVSDDQGAGQLFEVDGRMLAASTDLRIVREMVPVVQRMKDFEVLVKPSRQSLFREWGSLWAAKPQG